MPRADRLALLMVVLLPCAARAAVLTGEVRAADAQPLLVPPSDSSPVVLRYYAAEGQAVKAGDVVLRIDPGQSASQVRSLDAQIEQARAKAAKEIAELQVKRVDAEIALVDADAALAVAKLDAGVPQELISRLDYERHQGDLERTRRELALKRRELDDARAAVTRRQRDAELELAKLQLDRDYNAARLQAAELRAQNDGVVVHGFSNRREGGRIDEGDSVNPGEKVGEIVRGGAVSVRAWALEPDRRGLKPGQTVQLAFDARPGQRVAGKITSIAGAPEPKPEWGDGRYFTIDIALATPVRSLLPGMSVRIVTAPSAAPGVTR